MSKEWKKQAELDIPDAQPFDWTYSTPFKGLTTTIPENETIHPYETPERIDFESLKVAP